MVQMRTAQRLSGSRRKPLWSSPGRMQKDSSGVTSNLATPTRQSCCGAFGGLWCRLDSGWSTLTISPCGTLSSQTGRPSTMDLRRRDSPCLAPWVPCWPAGWTSSLWRRLPFGLWSPVHFARAPSPFSRVVPRRSSYPTQCTCCLGPLIISWSLSAGESVKVGATWTALIACYTLQCDCCQEPCEGQFWIDLWDQHLDESAVYCDLHSFCCVRLSGHLESPAAVHDLWVLLLRLGCGLHIIWCL